MRLKLLFRPTLLLALGLVSLCSCSDEDEDATIRKIDNVAYFISDGKVICEVVRASNAEVIRILPTVKLQGETRRVEYIKKEGFANSKVKVLYVPETIVQFGEDAFKNTQVRELHLESLQAWCSTSFAGYDALSNGKDPLALNYQECASNPINRETKIFLNGEPLDIISIPRDTPIGSNVFQNLNCEEVIIPEGVTKIGSCAFLNSSVRAVHLPNSVEIIWPYALYGCENIKELTLPDNLEYAGYCAYPAVSAFHVKSLENWLKIRIGWIYSLRHPDTPALPYGDSYYDIIVDNKILKEVTVPGYIGSINPGAFYGSNITELVAEEGVTAIGENALDKCKELTSVTLPSSLETMNCSFWHCDSLRFIVIRRTTPPGTDNWYFEFDSKVAANCTLYVPQESLEAYRNDYFWGKFQNILPIN